MSERWYHIQWSTFGAWLPGDPRGFRNHQHRIHSTGDYRRPPPRGEHAGLNAYARQLMHADEVRLAEEERLVACAAIVEKSKSRGILIASVSVSCNHVHALVRSAPSELGGIVAKLKRHSSHAMRETKPGRTWAARFHVVVVKDRTHQVTVFRYILAHARKERACVWQCVTGETRAS